MLSIFLKVQAVNNCDKGFDKWEVYKLAFCDCDNLHITRYDNQEQTAFHAWDFKVNGGRRSVYLVYCLLRPYCTLWWLPNDYMVTQKSKGWGTMSKGWDTSSYQYRNTPISGTVSVSWKVFLLDKSSPYRDGILWKMSFGAPESVPLGRVPLNSVPLIGVLLYVRKDYQKCLRRMSDGFCHALLCISHLISQQTFATSRQAMRSQNLFLPFSHKLRQSLTNLYHDLALQNNPDYSWILTFCRNHTRAEDILTSSQWCHFIQISSEWYNRVTKSWPPDVHLLGGYYNLWYCIQVLLDDT